MGIPVPIVLIAAGLGLLDWGPPARARPVPRVRGFDEGVV